MAVYTVALANWGWSRRLKAGLHNVMSLSQNKDYTEGLEIPLLGRVLLWHVQPWLQYLMPQKKKKENRMFVQWLMGVVYLVYKVLWWFHIMGFQLWLESLLLFSNFIAQTVLDLIRYPRLASSPQSSCLNIHIPGCCVLCTQPMIGACIFIHLQFLLTSYSTCASHIIFHLSTT